MERIAAETFTRMAKRLLVLMAVLAVVLAAMLAASVPAFAQEQASATGVLLAGLPADVGTNGTHSITDEASGTVYALESEAVDLDAYVGEQVTVYGTLTPGEAGSDNPGFEGNGTLPFIDVARVEPADGPPAGPSPGEAVTLSFELTVEGEPPEGTQFFGAPGEGGGPFFDAEGNRLRPVPLTDPEGDGVYTGSTTLANPGTGTMVSLPVQIVQENGGNIEVIRDFGMVPVDVDETFEANISFDEDGEGPTTPGVPSPQDRTATFDFELTVEGTPPEGARFFGTVPAEGCISVPLTDPDGDGLYTGSLDVPRFAPGPVPPDADPVSLPVQIVQADSGASPCNPTTMIREFGTVPADDDTFRARANFKENGGGTTPPEPGNSGGTDDSDGPGSGGSNNSGGSGSSGGSGNDAENSGSPSSITSGIRGLLPSTGGGVALTVLVAGVLLVAGGLLISRLAR